MAEQYPEEQRYKDRANRFRIEGALVLKNRTGRFFFYLLKTLWFPLQFIEYCFYILVYSIFRKKSYALLYNYQKRFFTSFFKDERVIPVEIYPIPKSFPKPTLIFTNRSSNLISPFLLTLFKSKVHIPVQDSLKGFPLNMIIRFFSMGHFIYSFGYRDNALDEQIETLHTLLKTDRPVISFLNKGFASQSGQDALHIYSEVLDFIRSDIHCYFVRLPHFEFNNITTFSNPNFISVTLKSKEDLFDGVDLTNDTEVIEQLVSFFNFRYGKFI
tara:strand:+ start:11195 stop:12007 length:813 start_codon:yes stop_codon:yes gene_type:complete